MQLKSLGKNVTEIVLPNGNTVLFSYSTAVACHVPGLGFYRTTERYSRTTSKHINQWLERHGARDVHTVEPSALGAMCDGRV